MNPIYTLQGNEIDRADTAGCNGKGWREDVSYTLNTIDRPAICFHLQQDPISSEISPCLGGQGQASVGVFMGGQGAKAGGIGYSESISPTLKSAPSGGNTVPTLVYDARGNGDGEKCPTLTGDHENRVTDYTAVCCMEHGEPRPVYGVDCRNAALDAGKPPRKYIIRRLTPLECCRLQGFPDGWGVPDSKPELSADELAFWQGVRDTQAAISGKPPKTYSAASLAKWYNALHTDSAEYKMWGNGIALPCAAFVLEGVAEKLKEGTIDG